MRYQKNKFINQIKNLSHEAIYNPLDQEGTVITMQGGKFGNVIVEWSNSLAVV